MAGVVLFGIAACGTAGTATPTANSPWVAYDPHWSNASWANCMRQHGIALNGPDSSGDIGFTGPPYDHDSFLAAEAQCEALWPPSKAFSIDQIISAQRYKQSFDACLQQGTSATSCRSRLGPALEVNGPRATPIP